MGIDFFIKFTKTKIPKWCIEQPATIMTTHYRKHDQTIQPYYFGDEVQKTTWLWLNGLPKIFHLKETDMFDEKTHVYKGDFIKFESGKQMPAWYSRLSNNSKERSRTFPGIAKAMAEQWG